MSGPIVRSGPSPEFTKNWDSVFGGKKKSAAAPAKAAAQGAKATKKSAKAKVPAKAAKKAVAKKK
jgi:hypothetical protein